MKKTRTVTLSFSKHELNMARLSMGLSGIMAPDASKMSESGYDYHKYDHANPISQMNFGLFGGGSSSANDYHKDLIAHDLVPRTEDFVRQNFRLLSATTVADGTWRATDFAHGDALQKSLKKLLSKPVYKNHDTDIENWVGLVEAVSWSEGYVDVNGNSIPAGIDGLVAIDAKTNPKIARGVLAGAIYANSVTVEFEWEPSHKYETEEEFFDFIGQVGADGTTVRRLVTNIVDFYESSLVWLGADPYARALDSEGKLVLPEMDNYSKETMEEYKTTKNYSIGLAMNKNVISLSSIETKNKKSTKDDFSTKKETMKELLPFLRTLLGLSETETVTLKHLELLEKSPKEPVVPITEEQKLQLDAFNKFEGLKLASYDEEGKRTDSPIKAIEEGKLELSETFAADNVVLSATALEALEKKVTDLTAEKVALAANAELGVKALEAKRGEAIRLYKLSVKETDKSVVELFESAKPEQVDGLLKQYTGNATGKFKGKCKDCGSEEFTFQSSVNTDGGVTLTDNEEVDFQYLHEKYSDKNRGL